jgi:hypothetical protein
MESPVAGIHSTDQSMASARGATSFSRTFTPAGQDRATLVAPRSPLERVVGCTGSRVGGRYDHDC